MSTHSRITSFAIAALFLAGFSVEARAAGTVTDCSTFGPGPGTLEAALVGGGTVTFACSGTIDVGGTVQPAMDTVIDADGQASVRLTSAVA